MKTKRVIGIVIAVGVIVFLVFRFLENDEKIIRKQFAQLAEWGSKKASDQPLEIAAKTKKIANMFDETCEVEYQERERIREYQRQDISRMAYTILNRYEKSTIKFYDIFIDFPSETRAHVTLTARLIGTPRGEETIEDIHEAECILEKIEKEWLISRIMIVDVLEK